MYLAWLFFCFKCFSLIYFFTHARKMTNSIIFFNLFVRSFLWRKFGQKSKKWQRWVFHNIFFSYIKRNCSKYLWWNSCTFPQHASDANMFNLDKENLWWNFLLRSSYLWNLDILSLAPSQKEIVVQAKLWASSNVDIMVHPYPSANISDLLFMNSAWT